MIVQKDEYHPMGRRRSGFTLIELLVVISIVALLMAILLPAMAQARATARDAVCKSRLRQLMVLVASYENDFGYILPSYISKSLSEQWYVGTNGINMLVKGGYLSTSVVGVPDDWSQGPRGTWMWVNNVARKHSLVLCPSKVYYGKHDVRIMGNGSIMPPGGSWTPETLEHRDGDSMNGAFGSLAGLPWTGNWTVPHSYGIIFAQRRDPGPGNHYHPIKTFTSPSKKVYFLEAHGNFQNGAEEMWWGQHAQYDWTWHYSFPHGPVSNRSANFTAYDGHVGTVSRSLAGLGVYYVPPTLPFQFH